MAEAAGGPRGSLARVRSLSERGLSRAADSLGRLLGYPVRLAVQEVRRLPSSTLLALAGDAGAGPAAGLRIRIRGEGAGWILILLPLPTVYRLLQALTGAPAQPRELTETERSAVQEVGNIVASSFLSEWGDLLGRRFVPSVPDVHLDNIPRLVRDVLASVHALGSEALVVYALLEEPARRIEGRVFIVPEVGALGPVAHGAAGERGVST